MARSNFIKTLVVFLLLIPIFNLNAGSLESKSNEKTVKILTIGNSFAENALTYLRQITESVDGCNIVIGKANIGGCYLEKHANLIKECEKDPALKPYGEKYTLKDMLLQEKWDVVTIQQVSNLSFRTETYQPYADEIVEFVKKYAPQTKIYIHETWAYAPDCPRLDQLGTTQKKMYRGLKKNYKNLSKRYDAPVLPSGDAFYRASKKDKDLDIWNPNDRFHANKNGCYLAGCVWFGKLFGISPTNIKFKPEEISVETAEYLKTTASKVEM